MSPLISRIGTVVIGLVSAVALATGCNQGAEGDRCNPDLSHDECGGGLQCTQPKDCPENYCCPANGTSSNPYCQPGCAGGQASICAAGGDADCPTEGGDGGSGGD
jgi:hypothetical protein